MENRRTSSRMKESGYKLKFPNIATHPINLDDDDLFSNPEGKAVAKITKKRKNAEKSRKTKKKEDSESSEEDKDSIRERPKRNNEKSNKKQKLTNNGAKKDDKKKDATTSIKKFQRLFTRMSPNSLYLAIKSLSIKQRQMVTDMGFGSLLGLKIETLPGKLSYYLVDKYRPSTSSIKLKNGELKITKETVEAMLGLPNGGVDFKLLSECKKTDPLLVAWKRQFENGKFNNGNYLKKIRGSRDADDMFKLNFLTLFINTIAETEKQGSCKIDFLRKLVHCADVSSIDWCQYMIDCLDRGMSKWRPNDKNCFYIGPVMLLMLAYADGVVCEDLQLRRLRPFVKEVHSIHLRVLEEYEVAKGKFGTLQIREQVEDDDDDREEMGEEEELPFNENEVPLGSVEAYCAILERSYKRVCEEKKNMEVAIADGLVKYPNNERLKEWLIKMEQLFSGTTISQIETIKNAKEEALKKQPCKQIVTNTKNIVGKEKREVKDGQTVCSPYVKSIVEVKDIIQQDEQLVSQVLLASTKDKRDIVWETSEGYGMHLEFAQTLTSRMKVHSNVIDCWAVLLNKSQVYKSETLNARLFFTTNALTDKMIDEREPQNFRYNDFQESLKAYIKDVTGKEDLTNIDLVFFPIVDGDKYYLVCFNLKRCAFMIIDHKKNQGSVESTYGQRPLILQSFFCAYLFKVGHKKANNMVSKNALMVKMKWQTEKNENDGGVFLMRHMESYTGDGVSKRDCGLGVESRIQETYLLKLRSKFLSKLMLSDFNVRKDEFLKDLHEFDNKEKFKDEGMKDLA